VSAGTHRFRREGLMRGLAFIGGQCRDGVLYAHLQGDAAGPGEWLQEIPPGCSPLTWATCARTALRRV